MGLRALCPALLVALARSSARPSLPSRYRQPGAPWTPHAGDQHLAAKRSGLTDNSRAWTTRNHLHATATLDQHHNNERQHAQELMTTDKVAADVSAAAAAAATDAASSPPKQTRKPMRHLDKRLPPSLRVLARLFQALEFGLGALTLYQRTPDFAAVKRAVESSSQISFTVAHLQQILTVLPGAYTLEWKKNTRSNRRRAQEEGASSQQAQRQQLRAQPPVLTLRKAQLPAPDSDCESLEARITLFYDKLNAYLAAQVVAIKKELPDMTADELRDALKLVEVDLTPLPPMPKETSVTVSQTLLLSKEEMSAESSAAATSEGKAVLEKPVPKDLQSLPMWLIAKVRRQEQGQKRVVENSEKKLKRRLLATLPQLSDQLQSLVMVTRKSVFAKSDLLKRLAAHAPIRGHVEEQLYLLESMVPEWVTVVIQDGKEYVKLATGCKYNATKASLRRAIASFT